MNGCCYHTYSRNSYWAVINHGINMCMYPQSHPLLTCNQRWYKMGKKGSISTENMQCLQYFVDTINCLHDWLRNDLMRKELRRRMYLVKKSIVLYLWYTKYNTISLRMYIRWQKSKVCKQKLINHPTSS